jgi:hypothetical protein
MDNLVTIQTFDNYIAAHIVKARLENRGIEAVLKDEQTITMNWLWNNALGGMKLQVLEKDVEAALKIIEVDEEQSNIEAAQDAFVSEDKTQFSPDNKICIYCGSKNTKAVLYNKKWAYTILLFLGFPLAVKSDKWHCFHCYKDF